MIVCVHGGSELWQLLVCQERFERVRWKTRNAQAARHAQVLRRFWHTSQRLVWQDALVVVMLGLSLGLSAVQLRPTATADGSSKHNSEASKEQQNGGQS